MLGRGSRPDVELPVVIHTWGAGPTVAVVANIHGDEVVGVGVIHALDAWLQEHGGAGTLVLYPSLNPQGLARQVRQVPADAVDLNRVFPGRARGGPASRLAAAVWSDLSARAPDLVIDLHADAPEALPYVIVDRPARLTAARRAALSTRLETLAEATGLTVLREYPDDLYLHFGLDHSLAGSVVNVWGVPALTIEVGPRRSMLPEPVAAGLEAVLGVLAQAGSVAHSPSPHPSRVPDRWRRGAPPRPQRGGLLVPRLRPGARFERGDVLAEIRDLTGAPIEELRAEEAGLVVSWVEAPWVSAGSLLGTLAVPDEGDL